MDFLCNIKLWVNISRATKMESIPKNWVGFFYAYYKTKSIFTRNKILGRELQKLNQFYVCCKNQSWFLQANYKN